MIAGGGVALAGACYAYNKTVDAYAYMQLAAAATEQLYMQQLTGVVELELCLRPFSSVGELRGFLTPVAEAPRTPGPMQHRAFTLLEPADVSSKSKARHLAAIEQQLPPVPTVRRVSLLFPLSREPTYLYCRKSREGGTHFFEGASPPSGWEGWTSNSLNSTCREMIEARP